MPRRGLGAQRRHLLLGGRARVQRGAQRGALLGQAPAQLQELGLALLARLPDLRAGLGQLAAQALQLGGELVDLRQQRVPLGLDLADLDPAGGGRHRVRRVRVAGEDGGGRGRQRVGGVVGVDDELAGPVLVPPRHDGGPERRGRSRARGAAPGRRACARLAGVKPGDAAQRDAARPRRASPPPPWPPTSASRARSGSGSADPVDAAGTPARPRLGVRRGHCIRVGVPGRSWCLGVPALVRPALRGSCRVRG